MKLAHLITQRSWQRAELTAAENWTVDQSYGLDLPSNITNVDAWWLPQAQAVQLLRATQHHNLPAPKFTAPSADLLSLVPETLTGRKVETMTVNEAASTLFPWPTLWWKMATAKHDKFAAIPRTHEELLTAISNAALPQNAVLQWSEEIPNILSEHRFFIRKDRKGFIIAAHSGYLKEGITVYDGAVFSGEEVDEAYTAVERLLEEDLPLPPSFVVDVAVTSGGSYILEFNPSWCSGWYDADVTEVLKTIERGFTVTANEFKKWKYVPDAALVERYSNPQRRVWDVAYTS